MIMVDNLAEDERNHKDLETLSDCAVTGSQRCLKL